MSATYRPEAACGYRYDDPAFDIDWPEQITVISAKDRELPFYDARAHRTLVQGRDEQTRP